MSNFRIGNLEDWSPVTDSLEYEVDEAPALVSIQLLASHPVNVFVTHMEGTPQLVAGGEGIIRVRFTASGDFTLDVSPQDDSVTAEVWLKGRREPQIVAESRDPSFTTIEPRPSGPNSDMRRFMLMQQLNNQRREQVLRDEITRLGADLRSAYRTPPAAAASTPPTASSGAPTASDAPSGGAGATPAAGPT